MSLTRASKASGSPLTPGGVGKAVTKCAIARVKTARGVNFMLWVGVIIVKVHRMGFDGVSHLEGGDGSPTGELGDLNNPACARDQRVVSLITARMKGHKSLTMLYQ